MLGNFKSKRIKGEGVIKDEFGEAVLRWQRNRMGRPLSPNKFIKRTFK